MDSIYSDHVYQNLKCFSVLSLDDATRVILSRGKDKDYINANYINMEIPGSGIINRYIATQGKFAVPLRVNLENLNF